MRRHLVYMQCNATSVLEGMYNEKESFDFNRSESNSAPKTGHFSQIVWKASKQLGVGSAKSSHGNFKVVFRYTLVYRETFLY